MKALVATLALVAAAASDCTAADLPWLTPAALRRGDTVALVAPCGIPNPDHVDAFASSLESAGFRIDRHEALTQRRHRYLAGTDDERADELNRAFRDPRIRGVFVVRGGFGLTRIIDRLDYEALRRDPKVIVGYSDVTALHVAVGRRARLITFHAPMAGRVTATGIDPTYADRSFRDMLLDAPTAAPRTIPLPDATRVTTVNGGRCAGRLVGGNLSLICATLGTPFAIDATDAVLFIEDVNERPYRVDRMMAHLRLAGVLDAVAGIVVGRFTCDEYEGDRQAADEREQREVLLEYCRAIGRPAVADFPCGHVRDNATLPLGARVTLDADAGTLTVVEPTCMAGHDAPRPMRVP